MRASVVIAILLLLVALPGCRRGRAAAPVPAPPAAAWTPAAAERVYYDNAGGIRDSTRLAIRDAARLQEVWAQATSRQLSPPPAPEVDFTREMLLVVAAGRRSPEDRIVVDSVRVQRETRGGTSTELAFAAVVKLVEGCGRFAADAYPLEIVRVPRFAGEIEWVERRERAPQCQRSHAAPAGATVPVPRFPGAWAAGPHPLPLSRLGSGGRGARAAEDARRIPGTGPITLAGDLP